MSDPLGYRRFCFPPLAACIVDTPESALMAGVGGKTSSVTMAFYKHFGDNFRHEPRTASTTIAQLMAIEERVDPWNLVSYATQAATFRLNGVHRPFWRDYPLAEPSIFLTPEPLHHWHKQFWYHDVKWCINAVGAAEIDFRFSVLHPHTSFRQFKEGISSLRQVTGREHRDVERYIIPVVAGAVSASFLVAIRSLLDFRYLAQAPVIDEDVCAQIELALCDFHIHKQAIIDAKARQGKGNAVITNWYIPKLEFLQSVVSNIRLNGVAIQWSADITENAHIYVAKKPAHAGNNQDYESQTCRYLDRVDKIRQFDLATSIRTANVDFRGLFDTTEDSRLQNSPDDNDDSDSDSEVDSITISRTDALLKVINPVSVLPATSRTIDYFKIASDLRCTPLSVPQPLRTYQSSKNVVFHLTRDPSLGKMTVDQAAAKFGLPDLRAALGDYMIQLVGAGQNCKVVNRTIGGRRHSAPDCSLPFTHVEVWNRVRLQTRSYYTPNVPLPAHTINAYPPSAEWPLGRYDSVLINCDPSAEWPQSGLTGMLLLVFDYHDLNAFKGHLVAELKLIFRIVVPSVRSPSDKHDHFLTYVQRFDIVPQSNSGSVPRAPRPEPSSSLYILKRAKRAGGSIIGDVVPLCQLRALVNLIPRFHEAAHRGLTDRNSSSYCTEFFLNKYFDKEAFWALHNSSNGNK